MAGAVCICSDLAALRTTVADRGILIQGDAYTAAYRTQAFHEVCRLLSDGERKRSLITKARVWALEQTWANRAKQWVAIFNLSQAKISQPALPSAVQTTSAV